MHCSDVPVSQWCNDKTFCTTKELHLVDKVYIGDGDNALVGVFLVVEPGLFQPLKVSRGTDVHLHLKI